MIPATVGLVALMYEMMYSISILEASESQILLIVL